MVSDGRAMRKTGKAIGAKKTEAELHPPADIVSKKYLCNSAKIRKLNKKLLIMDMAVGSSAEGVIISGLDGRLTYANKSFLKMFGNVQDPGDVMWRPFSSFFQYRKKALEIMKKVRSGESWTGTVKAVKQNGEVFYAKVSSNLVRNSDNTPLCLQASFSDVTKDHDLEQKLKAMNRELVKANKKLSHMAYRDSHTGLYSHRIYDSLIESEYQRAKRHGRPLSLMFIDVDFFKSINDVYGYIFGDVVLKQLAKKLVETTRSSDIAIRFGGEEFIIVLPETSREKALWLGKRIFNGIAATEFGKGKNKVRLKISAGVASYPEDGMKCPADMFTLAEKFVKKAKLRGGARLCSGSDVREKRESAAQPDNITTLKKKLTALSGRMSQSLIETLFEFARGTESKDSHFIGHSKGISLLSRDIAVSMHLPETEIKKIEQAALLCNIGKTGLKKTLLSKKGKWSAGDMEAYKKHIIYGVEILALVRHLRRLIPLVRAHHERWDGMGYPEGLKGNKIPPGSRIIAVADAYTALVSDRPGRKAFSSAAALKMIMRGSGKNFDPAVVKILREVMSRRINNRLLDRRECE